MKKILTTEASWDENRHYWKVSIQRGGVRKYFYSNEPGKKGKRIAEAKAAEWLEGGGGADPYIQEAWNSYLSYRRPKISYTTYVSQEMFGRKWLLPKLQGKRLSRIKPSDWQSVIDSVAAAGGRKSTCSVYFGFIKRFVSYCRMNRMAVEHEDLQLVSIPSEAARCKRKRSLQPTDIRVLFSSDKTSYEKSEQTDWYINAYRFCAITGLRRGQLAGLDWQDISDGMLTITRSVNRLNEITKCKTENAVRQIFLPKMALDVLEEQREMLKRNGIISSFIFPDECGKRTVPESLYRNWKRYCAYNGLPVISFHEIRHTTISMYRGSVDISLLKETVGHSASMDTFGVYGHSFDGKQQAAAKAMDEVLSSIIL